MRVLQINAVSAIRSTGRICSEISGYLNQNGHEGFIAYSGGIPSEKGFKIGSIYEKKLHALYSRVFGLQAYYSKNGTGYLLKYIDELKPDVVHLHNLHANYINLEMLLGYLAQNDIPTVITLHDCWFFTGKCTHYTVDNCYKWQSGCGGCPRLKKDNPSWFLDRTQKMHRDKKKWFSAIPRLAVVGVSDWITGEARKSFLSSANIITRIYNWIDLDVFRPAETSELRRKLNMQNKFIILGVASGWSNAKGLDKFIDLAKNLDSDFAILLVGGLREKVKLPNNITHIKETHDVQELARYYSLADVYLHLSLEETFGKTIAEALTCGTPAIVPDSTACPEIVGDGCGYILKESDLSEILSALNIVRTKGKQFYSPACINFVAQNFNAVLNMKKTVELYKELID